MGFRSRKAFQADTHEHCWRIGGEDMYNRSASSSPLVWGEELVYCGMDCMSFCDCALIHSIGNKTT